MLIKRINELLKDIDKNSCLHQEEWEIWSGEFNRKLRSLMFIDPEDQVERYKNVFSYWSLKNNIKKINPFDKNQLKELNELAKNLKSEALG